MSRARQVANFDPALLATDEVSLDKVNGGTLGTGTIGGSSVVNTSGAITTTGTATFSGDLVPSTPLSHRNMIINGGMQVAQRSSVAFAHDGTTVGYSEVDRYHLGTNVLGEWDGTMTQHSMDAADFNTTGFSKALKLTTGTAESSIGSSDLLYINQRIEAQNLQHLQYGTASAKTVTLSFWVKTSVTGTYAVGLYKPDATSRNVTATYTTTGTGWEYKTLTFAGDTDATATIANDNGTGFYVTWHLASGATYDSSPLTSWGNYASANWAGGHAQDGIVTTASATFYITGVQLELGSNATPFEHRSYADELARCQRYYFRNTGGTTCIAGQLIPSSTTAALGYSIMPVPLRTTSITLTSGSLAASRVDDTATVSSLTYQSGRSTNTTIGYDVAGSSFIADTQYFLTGNGSGAFIAFDTEL
jgi:hypothetical protein